MNMLLKSISVFSLFALIILSACGSTKSSNNSADNTTMAPVAKVSSGIESLDQFLASFEAATLKHSSSDLFGYFDKDYKKDQWELLLNKNTDSFLNKFFSNNQMVNDKPMIDYKNITGIIRNSVVLNTNYFLVNYTILQGNIEVKLQITVFSKLEKGVLKYSIYGPIG